MTNTNRLALPYLAAAQSQKHVTHNEALQMLDALVQISVLEQDKATPPSTPAEGMRYLVAISSSGDFAGQGGKLAAFDDGAWRFLAPQPGWLVHVAAGNRLMLFDGTGWRDIAGLIGSLGNLATLGVGTDADAGNPLSAKLNDALFTARFTGEGGTGSLRMKLNKEGPSAAVSQLYQSGWSGRAETGLTGDDRFRIRVSPDGSSWRDSLLADPATGAVSFPSGVSDLGGSGLSELRNHVLNGDFWIAQRGGGPFTLAQAASYGFDGWLTRAQAAGATGQLTRTPFAPGQTAGPVGRFFATLGISATTASALPEMQTRLEDVGRLAGRLVTVSFWYRTASASFNVELAQAFGAGGGAMVEGLGQTTLPAAAGWTFRTISFALPGIAGQTVGAGSYTALRFVLTGASAGSLDLADVQLEEGGVATPFARGTPAVDMLLARRHFRRSATLMAAADLAFDMRASPTVSGTGPYSYSAEL